MKGSRMRRLSKLLEKHPAVIDLGIDERTALIAQLKGRQLSVIGDSCVTAYLKENSHHPGQIEFLKQGDQTDIAALRDPDTTVESPWDLDAILAGEE